MGCPDVTLLPSLFAPAPKQLRRINHHFDDFGSEEHDVPGTFPRLEHSGRSRSLVILQGWVYCHGPQADPVSLQAHIPRKIACSTSTGPLWIGNHRRFTPRCPSPNSPNVRAIGYRRLFRDDSIPTVAVRSQLFRDRHRVAEFFRALFSLPNTPRTGPSRMPLRRNLADVPSPACREQAGMAWE